MPYVMRSRKWRKSEAKFKREHRYSAKIGETICVANGRTKREATKRLRHMFGVAGVSTMPTPGVDLLTVSRER